MTCREKLKMEYPDLIDERFKGGCVGCPSHYCYASNPEYCIGSSIHNNCTKCWDREVEDSEESTEDLKEPLDKSEFNTKILIHIIETAMKSKDHSICLYLGDNGEVTCNIYPYKEE